MNIPFAVPFIGREEEEAVLHVLRSGWITTANEALSFEKEFSAFLCEYQNQIRAGGSGKDAASSASLQRGGLPPHNDSPGNLSALAVNSATSGLHLALEACGVKKGDVVLVPTCTFASDAEVVHYLGAETAFVDSARGAFNMCPAGLESTLKRLNDGKSAYENGGPKGRAAAIIAVHFGGMVCDMAAIMKIARHYNVAVIEDCAHSFPAFSHDKMTAGTIGDVGVFSFYATKTITTGEGGMVVTRNLARSSRMQTMRLHGIDRPIWNRYNANASNDDSGTKTPSWYYQVAAPGYKYNLCDILAAIGRVQLKRAEFLLKERQHIASIYNEHFAGDDNFILPPSNSGNAWHLYPLRVSCKNKNTRDDLFQKLKENGIGASVHFIPLHTMPYYKKLYDLHENDFPNAYENFRTEISLPIFPGMSDEQVKFVIDAARGGKGMGTNRL
ncbi:spore coat protein [Spirochaetia bacterium]|nr:spore coat protein [Spirochaetia bacterium]